MFEVIRWVLIVVLVCMSGLFSGLTLGLLGLDLMGLEIVIRGSKRSRRARQRAEDL